MLGLPEIDEVLMSDVHIWRLLVLQEVDEFSLLSNRLFRFLTGFVRRLYFEVVPSSELVTQCCH